MSWRDDFKEAFTELPGDVMSAAGKTYDVAVNDNDRDFNMSRRNFIQAAGTAALGTGLDLGEDGDIDSYDAAAGAAGSVWHEVDKRLPDYRINIEKVNGGSQNGGAADTPTPTNTPTPTDTPENTPTNTETSEPTETSTPTPTTTEASELAYESISAGLLEESEGTREGFRGYSLTALDDQLDGVGLHEAVLNAGDYEEEIMGALEGSNYDDGALTLGDYEQSVDLVDEIGASQQFDSYVEELDDRGELEGEMFDYFDSLERADL